MPPQLHFSPPVQSLRVVTGATLTSASTRRTSVWERKKGLKPFFNQNVRAHRAPFSGDRCPKGNLLKKPGIHFKKGQRQKWEAFDKRQTFPSSPAFLSKQKSTEKMSVCGAKLEKHRCETLGLVNTDRNRRQPPGFLHRFVKNLRSISKRVIKPHWTGWLRNDCLSTEWCCTASVFSAHVHASQGTWLWMLSTLFPPQQLQSPSPNYQVSFLLFWSA